jgi:hypothetical protein
MKHSYQRSNLKFGACVLFAVLFSGCASSIKQPINIDDLNSFYPNCEQKDEQVLALTRLIPRPGDEKTARLQLAFLGSFSGDYENKEMIADGRMENVINQKVTWVRQRCGY